MTEKQAVLILVLILTCCGGKEDRIIERWHNNEVKVRKVYLNDRDTAHHIILTYYKNGQLNERTPYIATARNGWSLTFHNNGQVKDSVFYRDNIPTTTTKQFHSNGKLAYEGVYNEIGKREGWWTSYDSLGRLVEKTEFTGDEGKKVVFCFDSHGRMTKEMRFQDGTLGIIDEELNYKDNVLHGQYTKYFENGSVETIGKYINGERVKVTWTDFHDNGQKSQEYQYTDESDLKFKIINAWGIDGVQIVKDGKGRRVTYENCSSGKPKIRIITYYFDGDIDRTFKKRLSFCR